MPQINRVPRGLNDLLQLQSKGLNPNELRNDILSTIDLTPFLLSQKNLIADVESEAVPAVNAPNFFAVHEVPAGELWIVRALSCVTSASTATVLLCPGMEDVNAGNADILFKDWSFKTAVGGVGHYNASMYFDNPLWVGAGSKLGGWIQLASDNITLTTRIMYTKLSV